MPFVFNNNTPDLTETKEVLAEASAELVKEQWVSSMINCLALRSKELQETIDENPKAAEVSYLKWLLDQNEDKLLRLLTL